jgi:hypothetical protein
MKKLNEFSLTEWLRLRPLTHAFKQLRNDAQLAHYLRKPAEGEQEFIDGMRNLAGRNVLVVIAFEQPLALHWLLYQARRHVPDFTVLVFDNSRSEEARRKIRRVCAEHAAPYLPLPENRTRHVNRSHGLAMSWVFEHVIRAIRPDVFGYIDHDMIPIGECRLAHRLDTQACYGLINRGSDCWNLWAGYCLFRYREVEHRRLNFLYDFSRGVDTGGRNWDSLYRHLDARALAFAEEAHVELENPETGKARTVQIVDRTWAHIGGVGYNNNFDEKRAFFSDYFRALGVPQIPES